MRADNRKKRLLDKFRGCLIGGAAGDALGYAVEFLDEASIFTKFSKTGITKYELHNGKALISDDTQMTMFTANGLLFGITRGHMRGIMGSMTGYLANAYREWYKTQIQSYEHCVRRFISCWLMNVPALFAARAPGNTCLSAIDAGCIGTIEEPTNNSKGCGGLMRVAPIGLYFKPSEATARLGAEAAALTHGHEMGYIPAAMLVHIVSLVSHNDAISLKDAVLDAKLTVAKMFDRAEHLSAFFALIDQAVALSESDLADLDAIHRLGAGWVGEEALAIAIYCALKYSDDFDRAIITAVNHGGDSDSTGAICGNILGAHLGLSRIPRKYIKSLELKDVILELADDLSVGCPVSEYSPVTTQQQKDWMKKYVYITYPED